MAWNDLNINQRSQLMNMFRRNGVTSLSEMRRLYDLSSPLVETSQLSQTSVAPVYRKGGKKKPNLSPQGVSEDSPEFVGPSYYEAFRTGPEVPYGFYDAPIDWNDIEARQHWAESRFKNKQKSGPGARGPFQIMPKTWDAYQKKLNLNGNIDNYNDNKVIRDALMKDLYNSRWATKGYPSDSVRTAKALAAYNWGSGNLTEHLNNLKQQGTDIYHSMDWIDTLPNETRNYVNFTLRGKDGPADLTNEAFQAALPNRFSAFPEVQYAKGGKIHINPKNRGKFNATKKRTGKTTEELTHSKNPLTRKRAIFAQNARKWHKKSYGGIKF